MLDYKGDNIRLKYVSEMLDIVGEKGKGKQDAFREKMCLYVGVSLYAPLVYWLFTGRLM